MTRFISIGTCRHAYPRYSEAIPHASTRAACMRDERVARRATCPPKRPAAALRVDETLRGDACRPPPNAQAVAPGMPGNRSGRGESMCAIRTAASHKIKLSIGISGSSIGVVHPSNGMVCCRHRHASHRPTLKSRRLKTAETRLFRSRKVRAKVVFKWTAIFCRRRIEGRNCDPGHVLLAI